MLYAAGMLRVSLTDFFMSRVEAPVITVPFNHVPVSMLRVLRVIRSCCGEAAAVRILMLFGAFLVQVFGVCSDPVWLGIHGGIDVISEVRQQRIDAKKPAPTPVPAPSVAAVPAVDAVSPPPPPSATAAKPFGCKLCPKAFTTAENLARHSAREHADAVTEGGSAAASAPTGLTASEQAAAMLGVLSSQSGSADSGAVAGIVEVVSFRFASTAVLANGSCDPVVGMIRTLAVNMLTLESAFLGNAVGCVLTRGCVWLLLLDYRCCVLHERLYIAGVVCVLSAARRGGVAARLGARLLHTPTHCPS